MRFGDDIQRLREDAGVSLAQLGRAAGIDSSYLARVERGAASPSIETIVRLGLALGADASIRLYPTTGPSIRDRHQTPIADSLIRALHPRWRPYPEIAVRHPSRGWIDLGLHDAIAGHFVATEIQSELRRLEQLIRWSGAKADSIRSWDGWTHLGAEPRVSRLLVIRETRANRAVVQEASAVLRASYPGHAHAALDALSGAGDWPGSSLLWAVRDRSNAGRYRLAVRPWA